MVRLGGLPEDRSDAPMPEEPQRLLIRLSSGSKRGEIRARMDVPPSDSVEFTGERDFISTAIVDVPYVLMKQPGVLFKDLGQAIMVDYLGELLHSHRHDEVLELLIKGEAIIRLPWELATHNQVPLKEEVALVRRVHESGETSENDRADVISSQVLLTIAAERKDRGHVYEILANAYGPAAHFRPSEQLLRAEPKARIVHLVAEIAQQRNSTGIYLGGDFVTCHNLADWLNDNRVRLLVLDLVFESSDASAVKQLMLANSFATMLCTYAPYVSVLCGVFAAGSDHIGRVPILADGLKSGRALSRLAGELQRFRELLPRSGGHPLRNAVSLVTEDPDSHFVLEK